MIIDLSLSGQDIADLVECSRPKASECLKKLVAEGAVMREHRRFIIDTAKIETLLRSSGFHDSRYYSPNAAQKGKPAERGKWRK